jgi:hypothetical protein
VFWQDAGNSMDLIPEAKSRLPWKELLTQGSCSVLMMRALAWGHHFSGQSHLFSARGVHHFTIEFGISESLSIILGIPPRESFDQASDVLPLVI